jgi:hypothetical protein
MTQPNAVASRLMGSIKIVRVFPAQTALQGWAIADLFYGPDPNGNCALANTAVPDSIVATAQLNCRTSGRASHCRGNFVASTLLPPECSDVHLTMEGVHFEVYDSFAPGSTTSLLARDGLKVFGDR